MKIKNKNPAALCFCKIQVYRLAIYFTSFILTNSKFNKYYFFKEFSILFHF
jgi:hypothetical protein